MRLPENPVMQRELLVNLRTKRSFLLLLVYQATLALLVYLAWPRASRLQANAGEARDLVNLFFLGQYTLASLMTPSFAAASIAGEKERKTYEMLLASPLRPAAICWGKLVSSLVPLLLLMVASAPIVVLCLPLGGVSIYEVFVGYLGLLASVVVFGMISVACSCYFQRTSSALVVSYLLILPLALVAVMAWSALEGRGSLRLWGTALGSPVLAAVICVPLFRRVTRRLLHPPDVGSEGRDVVDLERESREAVGLVLRPDQFPDRLFAPSKREDLLADDANPIYDKEIRSEIFSQGTLMLRLVIQISMLLAIPIMAMNLFVFPWMAPWYIAYVLLFNMLVGPVFSAGSLTSERERQTLSLLLTTTLAPWDILWGKLLAGLRVSCGLTLLLMWPLFLAVVLVPYFWENWQAVLGFLAVIFLTCLTTALVALGCSSFFQKTTTSLMTAYTILLLLFAAPIAAILFAGVVFRSDSPWSDWLQSHKVWLGVTSPFAAVFSTPMPDSSAFVGMFNNGLPVDRFFPADWRILAGYCATTVLLDAVLFFAMVRQFRVRWRVAR